MRKTDRIAGYWVVSAVAPVTRGDVATFGQVSSDGECGPVAHAGPQDWLDWLLSMALAKNVTCIVADATSTDRPAALGLLDLAQLIENRPDWQLNESAMALGRKVMLLSFECPENEDARKLTIIGSEQMFCGVEFDLTDSAGAAAHMARLLRERKAIVREFELGGLAITPAAQSLQAVRRHVRPYSVVVRGDSEEPRRHEAHHTLSALGYAGGRREVRTGHYSGDKYFYLDFDSAYCRLLGMNAYPVRPGHRIVVTPDRLRNYWLRNGHGIVAAVEVIPHRGAFPLRPVVARTLNGRGVISADYDYDEHGVPEPHVTDQVDYPIGEPMWAVMTTRELLREARGDFTMLRVGACYDFAMDTLPWSPFAKRMLELSDALEGTEHEAWSKMARNLLHGKLAQKHSEKLFADPEDLEGLGELAQSAVMHEGHYYRRLFNRWVAEGVRRWSANTLPAMAAHLTSDCRLALFDFVECAGRDNCVYMHTDGCVVNKAGYEAICEGYAGLPWRLKGEYSEVTVGVEGFRTDTDRKMSGIPSSAQHIKDGLWEWANWDPYHGQKTGGRVEAIPARAQLGS